MATVSESENLGIFFFSLDHQHFKSGVCLEKKLYFLVLHLWTVMCKHRCISYINSAFTFKFSLQPSAHSCVTPPHPSHTHTHTPLTLIGSLRCLFPPCADLPVWACPRDDSPLARLEAASASPAAAPLPSHCHHSLSHKASIECQLSSSTPTHCGH